MTRNLNKRWLIFLLGAVLVLFLLLMGENRKLPISSGTIVFLGDSITAGNGLAPEQAYPALIQIKGMTMLNLGVSGNKTEDGLLRLKEYFSAGGTPRLVVVELGANDIFQGVSANVMEANLESIIQECRSHGVPVMLCGIRIPWKIGIDDIFADVARESHVPLLKDVMQGEQNQPEFLQDDGIHPNAAGQKIIAQKMQEALLRFFSFAPQK